MVDVLRRHPPAIAWLNGLGSEPVVISGLVAMELYQGCRDRVEHEKVERVLRRCNIVWPSETVCEQALSWFAAHHLASAIGILDVLIGQTSIALGVTLYTFNTRHYQALTGIDLKQPYARNA